MGCPRPGEMVSTYALMAIAVFQLLFANSFAAVFASAFVTCTTSLTYTLCCAALGAGIVKIALAVKVRVRICVSWARN